MAYISLELILFICFISVYGVIEKCYIGGIDARNCDDDIMRGSVLQQFYISNFGTKNKSSSSEITHEDLDIPYTNFKHEENVWLNSNQCGTCSLSSTSSENPYLCNLAPEKTGITADEEFDIPYQNFKPEDNDWSNSKLCVSCNIYKECEPNSFMYLLCTENNSEKSLLRIWNEILYYGTDTYILKFYNKLVNMYKKDGKSAFSNNGQLLFIKSSYIAASVYYLTNNYDIAYEVVNEGIDFFYLVKNSLCNKLVEEEVLTWGILNLSLKIDIMGSAITVFPYLKDLNDAKYMLKELEGNLDTRLKNQGIEKYPCSYMLMFRSLFLNEDLDQNKKDKLINISKFIQTCEDHMDSKLFSLYHYLISIPNVYTHKDYGLYSLLKAFKKPVLSIEDRLLNYKLTVMTIDLYKTCIQYYDGDLNSPNKVICDDIKQFQHIDSLLGNIVTKLTYLITYDKKTEDIESNIFIDEEIDENFVHMIVTMAIDMDSKSEAYKKKIKNVESTIDILNTYITKKNEIGNDITTSMKKQIGTAYKWLVELNAVLCNSSIKDENGVLRSSLFNSLLQATKYLNPTDLHLEYLTYKYECKDVCELYSWENRSKTNGWILDTTIINSESKYSPTTIRDFRKKGYKFLKLSHKFINKTDVLIQLSRCFAKTNFIEATKYIKDAIKEPVITPEDRYRNLEAHEIYSMMVMLNNNELVKKKKQYQTLITAKGSR